MIIDKIIFFYPSKITGGAEYLFMRNAEYLAENNSKYKIYYIDYSDGFAKKNIKSNSVNFIEFNLGVRIPIPDGSIIIAQLNLITEYYKLLNIDWKKSTVMYWCLHTLNVKSAISTKGIYLVTRKERRLIGDEITYLAQYGVIKFMSFIGYAGVIRELFQQPIKLEWLPNITPINNSIKPPICKRIGRDRLMFCWLGRLDKEKTRNIITYMNELEVLNKTTPLSLNIIGLGAMEIKLKQLASKYTYPICFVGEKRDEQLDNFIRNEVEIGLASGTSALEFSLRGKPVIIDGVLKRVYKAGERQAYTLTYEEEDIDYSFGLEVRRYRQGSFLDKLKQILDNYENEAGLCYQYVIEKTPQNCSSKLLESIDVISKLDCDMVCDHVGIISSLLNRGIKRKKFIRRLLCPFK